MNHAVRCKIMGLKHPVLRCVIIHRQHTLCPDQNRGSSAGHRSFSRPSLPSTARSWLRTWRRGQPVSRDLPCDFSCCKLGGTRASVGVLRTSTTLTATVSACTALDDARRTCCHGLAGQRTCLGAERAARAARLSGLVAGCDVATLRVPPKPKRGLGASASSVSSYDGSGFGASVSDTCHTMLSNWNMMCMYDADCDFTQEVD